MQTLRPYQAAAVDRAQAARRALIVAPPGAGKTTIAAEIIRREIDKPRPSHQCPPRYVLVLAHRKELIAQAANRIKTNTGIDPVIIQAGQVAPMFSRVIVASVQTLARRLQWLRRRADMISLVIIDEAHRAPAKSYQKILDRLNAPRVIGLTASPYRLDGKPLGDLFDEMIVAAEPGELVAAGHLIEPRIFAAPLGGALEKVKKARGDYERGALATAMNDRRLTGRVVEHYLRHARGKTAVVFAAGVDHSRALVADFVGAGVIAEHLDGKTPAAERDRILSDLRSGFTRVVSNCEILTEGWDLPSLGAVILARPTMSPGLFIQMIGRVLRPKPDGSGGVIIDHAGCVAAHGWPTASRPWSLDSAEERPRADDALPGFSNCGRCFALFARRGRDTCPECGERLPRRETRKPPIETREALIEWKREEQEKRRAKAASNADRLFMKDTITGDLRGYSQGWAAVRYKSRCGRWPSNELKQAAIRAIDHG